MNKTTYLWIACLFVQGVARGDMLYVSSVGNHSVFGIETQAGQVQHTIRDPGFLVNPRGLALNASGTQIHVASPTSNYASLQYDISTSTRLGGVVNTAATSSPRGLELASNDQRLYIAGISADVISVHDFSTGKTTTVISGQLTDPLGIRLAAAEDSLFIANSDSNTVVQRSLLDNSVIMTYASPVPFTADLEFSSDRKTMYVSTFGDQGNGIILPSILSFDVATGSLLSNWSDPQFNGDYYGLALSSDGNRLYTADWANSRILEFDTTTGAASLFSSNAALINPSFLRLAAVPEPSSLVLLSLALWTAATRRTRR